MMYQYLAAFFIGILGFQHQPVLPAIEWSLLVLVLPLGWKAPPPLRLGAMCLAGWLWAWGHAAIILATELEPRLEDKDLLVEGRIEDLPSKMERGQRFVFRVTRLSAGGTWRRFPARIQLHWYHPTATLNTGDPWLLTVRLKRPHGLLNPGGLDYEKWLFEQRIRATGYVLTDARNRRLGAGSFAPLSRLRQSLADKLQVMLLASPSGGLIRALAVGDRGGITTEQWRTLRATGTNHLVAISGLHIGLVAGGVFFLFIHIWNIPGLAQLLRASKAAALASISAAGIYAALAGFSLPTQRAFCMVCVAMVAVLLAYRARPIRLLAIALWAVLILDPVAVLSMGFWLSFCAVALLIVLSHGRYGRQPVWLRWSRLQLGLFIGLAPLLLAGLGQVALLAPIANAIAIPWISLLVVPMTLIGSLLLPLSQTLSGFCLLMAATLLQWLWPLLEWLAAVPGALWRGPVPQSWALVAAGIGALWLIAPRGWPARWLGALLLLPVLLVRVAVPDIGAAWVTLLDVGQGLAVVVRTTHNTLVYDAGPRFSGRFNTGSAVVVPFLRHDGLDHVDRLVVSHDDNDHAGGVAGLLEEVSVSEILAGVPEALAPVPAKSCHAPQTWNWDQVRFQMLHPQANHRLSGNDASCVLHITSASGSSILLPGDIEKGVEFELVQTQPRRLSATVLVAPHHGSATSSSRVFLQQVRPRYVLFPVGYRNRWGFPRREVVGRYRDLGAVPLDTAASGAITLQLPATGFLPPPEAYRRTVSRYWNDR